MLDGICRWAALLCIGLRDISCREPRCRERAGSAGAATMFAAVIDHVVLHKGEMPLFFYSILYCNLRPQILPMLLSRQAWASGLVPSKVLPDSNKLGNFNVC